MSASDTFTAKIEAYLAATGMAPATFGLEALNDRGFVLRLRAGRSPTLETVDKVLAWMAANPARETA